MAATLNGTLKIGFDGSYDAGASASGRVDRLQIGNNAPKFIAEDAALAYGTGTVLDANGAIPVNDWYDEIVSITTGATKTIDLTGGSDANPFGVALAFTVVKCVIVALLDPDGINYVKVGPQAVANAWQGWFGGTGAGMYESVYWSTVHAGPAAGWTVTAGTGDLFTIINPNAGTVSVAIFIAGKK